MRALTLHQPWASLIALGEKQIETRSWSTRYRGTLAIHAAKGYGPHGNSYELWLHCRQEPFVSALAAAGIRNADQLPQGCVVALATLAEIITTEVVGTRTLDLRRYARHEAHFGDYSAGRYAWILQDVCPLAEPLPVRGRQGLWTLDRDAAREALRRSR